MYQYDKRYEGLIDKASILYALWYFKIKGVPRTPVVTFSILQSGEVLRGELSLLILVYNMYDQHGFPQSVKLNHKACIESISRTCLILCVAL